MWILILLFSLSIGGDIPITSEQIYGFRTEKACQSEFTRQLDIAMTDLREYYVTGTCVYVPR